MKLVFSSGDSSQVGLARSRLEAAGIPCEIRNDGVSQAIPGVAFGAELWVLNDEEFDDARTLIFSEGEAGTEAPPGQVG